MKTNSFTTLPSGKSKLAKKLLHCISFFCRLFVPLLLLAPLTSLRAADAPKQKPNIILFLIDDLGWRDLGCQGSTYYQTPNIDRLAEEGVRFTDAYAACAVCSPTRAAVLTGKYPARLLLTDWLPSGRWDPKAKLREGRFLRGLPVEEVTLDEALREGGYRTANIGQWHLGSEPFSLPEHHGFDVNIAGNAHGAPGNYFFPYAGDWLIPTTDQRAKWNVLPDGKPDEYLTDRLTDEAVKFIRDSRDKPFFLYVPHYGVHTPLQAKADMIAKYERIPEAQRQGKPSNAPLRANKGAYYEGGIRVPLIIKWPGVAKAGRVVNDPVTSTDLYPTCLAATAQPLRLHQHVDGVKLQSVLTGNYSLPPRSLFWHYPHYNKHPSSVPSSVIRKGPWKLIVTFDPEGIELYNLADDLGESKNLADHHKERVDELRRELDAWRKDIGAEMMKPNADYDPAVKPTKKKKKKEVE